MSAAQGCIALTCRTRGYVQETLEGWRLMSVPPHYRAANVHTFVLLPADPQSEWRRDAFSHCCHEIDGWGGVFLRNLDMVLQHDWVWPPGVMALSGTSNFLDRMCGNPVGSRNCLTREWQQTPTPHPPMRAAHRLLSFLTTLRDRCRDGTAE